MPNAYGAVVAAPGLYTGLAPEAALAKWYANREAVIAKAGLHIGPDGLLDAAGNHVRDSRVPPEVAAALDMSQLADENPAAWRLVATGKDNNGKTQKVFDTMTGQWKDQEVKGFWSHPESWLQLLGAGSVAAPLALGALGAAGGASAAPTTAAAAGPGVGIGETGATVGLTSGAGIPGAVAAPSVGAAGASGAAGINAGIGAGTAAPAAKSASSWLTGKTADLITTGIGAAGNIWATNRQLSADAEAARIQAESFDKALAAEKEQQDYNRNQYASYLTRLDPYAQAGYAANDRLSRFLGQPPSARPAPPTSTTQPVGNPNQPLPGSQVVNPPPAEAPRMVKMVSPTGVMRDVPADQVSLLESKGALVVNG